MTAAPVASAALPPRFAEYIATLRDAGENHSMSRYPGLRSAAWHDASRIPLARELEAAAPQIIEEFRRLDPRAFAPEKEAIPRRGAWDVFFLYERGRRHDEHCRRCPAAAAVVENQRTVRTLAGLAYFSRLAPHSRVAPHRGPTNMRLRAHLGIAVPANCGIRAGDTSTTWCEGACIVFDDSFPHEVWNESAHERIVLVVDLWHPDLSDGLQRYWARNEPSVDADVPDRVEVPSGE
jgi:aspartyl/asparaginyl beta-hydroxylase (cupin superfamily)